MRRVVVTGLGILNSLGGNLEENWQRIVAGKSGISAVTHFDVSDLPSKIASQIIPDAIGLTIEDYVDGRERRRMDDFIVYGLIAAVKAIESSGWQPDSEEAYCRTGVLVGSGIGGLPAVADTAVMLHEHGPKRISPFFIPSSLINLLSGYVSIRYGYKGPNHCVATACSTGSHAIGDAARLIISDDADVMIAGGAESAICPIGIAGFAAMRALSTRYNETPERASRPWDKDRDGFVLGEGAGILVLEELEHAKRRGATIWAELKGYGLSGDAHHITAPAKDGDGAYRCMQAALKRAKLVPSDIDYINAHGTSTPLGDEIEFRAVQRLLGESARHVLMSSTKSAIGHLLGAAGAIEAIYSILALRDGVAPPTINLDNPSDECRNMDLVPWQAKEKPLRHVLSNSFGFGGTNAALVFGRFDG